MDICQLYAMIALERLDSYMWLRITWKCKDLHCGMGTCGYAVGWQWRVHQQGHLSEREGLQIQRGATLARPIEFNVYHGNKRIVWRIRRKKLTAIRIQDQVAEPHRRQQKDKNFFPITQFFQPEWLVILGEISIYEKPVSASTPGPQETSLSPPYNIVTANYKLPHEEAADASTNFTWNAIV